MALWWYHRHKARLAEVRSDVMPVIGLVHQGMGQRWLGRPLRAHGRKHGTLRTVPGWQDDGDAGAFIATARMPWGGQAAPRAPQSLGSLPPGFFHAPAAC
jgi:hypothetical protein